MKQILRIGALACLAAVPVYTQVDLKEFFTAAYEHAVDGTWGALESVSGPGSTLEQTAALRAALPTLLSQYNIHTIIDAPCGDFNWLVQVAMPQCHYLGIDIVQELIAHNNARYASPNRLFACLDALTAPLVPVDLIISRDFLVHLSYADICAALRNFKKSGSRYLLTTTFPTRENHDIESGGWQPLNLQAAPFNFPEPLMVVNEQCSEQNGSYKDKSIGLWRLHDLPIAS